MWGEHSYLRIKKILGKNLFFSYEMKIKIKNYKKLIEIYHNFKRI
jgi:hypothetical protein